MERQVHNDVSRYGALVSQLYVVLFTWMF